MYKINVHKQTIITTQFNKIDLLNFFISYKYYNNLANDSTVLSRKIELEAEQLMWALTPLEAYEGLACHINSYHLAKMVDHVIPEELTN